MSVNKICLFVVVVVVVVVVRSRISETSLNTGCSQEDTFILKQQVHLCEFLSLRPSFLLWSSTLMERIKFNTQQHYFTEIHYNFV